MSGRRVVTAIALLALAVGLLTCGGEPSQPPTPGWLDVRLVSPGADDGGLLFVVSGPSVETVTSPATHTFLRREGPSSVRVIIVGNVTSGVIARIHVPDTRAVDSYHASLLEVAARSSFEERSLAGYSLVIDAGR